MLKFYMTRVCDLGSPFPKEPVAPLVMLGSSWERGRTGSRAERCTPCRRLCQSFVNGENRDDLIYCSGSYIRALNVVLLLIFRSFLSV